MKVQECQVITSLDGVQIELSGFWAKPESDQVQLSWQTASESKNSGFEVQKSIDGREWQILGFVEGKGNSSVLNDYQFVDSQPFGSINYYRLKQIDFDGAFEFSNVVSVVLGGENKIHIYPHPTDGLVKVSGLESGSVKVMDSFGRIIKEETWSGAEINISDAPSGIYFLQICYESQKIFTQRIFKE